MSPDNNPLYSIHTFKQLVTYLRKELDWPIESDDFEELTFDYAPEELGLDAATAVKIKEIKQLRPLTSKQPWGVFFVNFEPKHLPVVVLRRILSKLVIKKRQSANKSQQAAWQMHDLLFVSSYGEDAHRDITFAHFSEEHEMGDLPTLRVLGWDDEDTKLKVSFVEHELKTKLRWPKEEKNVVAWRMAWASAFKLRPREVIKTSQQLAIRLAELARNIRKRANNVLAIESAKGPLRKMHAAFKEALIHDLSTDDFADMYAQTISYGLLTARVSRPSGLVADNLSDMVPVTNPFLKELLQTFLTIGGRKGKIDFDELGINEVVQLLRDADMEAVLRDFGDRNPEEDPVIHFYELFLKEYDAKKRMQRGVFYTPRPVVSFIVRSVHETLQNQFALEDGLADTTTWEAMVERHKGLSIPRGVSPNAPFVQILDPATGTGTFLVEAIEVIRSAMEARWKKQGHMALEFQQLWNEYVPNHLLPRLHGFELMMAPYAIAHMKIGLKLYETGYKFQSDERARVYLTNTLEPPTDFSDRFEFDVPALAHEARAAGRVKSSVPITIIIGNPPYSERSSNSGEFITQLMEQYKRTIRGAEAQIKTVSNDYVKFLRYAHFVSLQTGFAVVGMITANGYLDGILFRDLRESWVHEFSRISLLNLNGSGRRGDTDALDENVFEILQGVSICLFTTGGTRLAEVSLGSLVGSRAWKYKELASNTFTSLRADKLKPIPPLFSFKVSSGQRSEYQTWSLADIFGTGDRRRDRNKTYAGGFKTRQDSFTVGFSAAELKARIEKLASSTPEAELRDEFGLCTTAHFDFARARKAARNGELESAIKKVRYRPFDDRPMIWAREVLCEPQTSITDHLLRPNLCLATSRVVKDSSFKHVSIARGPVEVISLSNSTSTNAYMYPLYLYDLGGQSLPLRNRPSRHVNFSPEFISSLREHLGIEVSDSGTVGSSAERSPEFVLGYIYAILHSPGYRHMFAEELLEDFPEVPLVSNLDIFDLISQKGSDLIALHLLEVEYPLASWVTNRKGSPFKALPEFVKSHPPRVEPGYPKYENARVLVNSEAYFKGISEDVWAFKVGNYQVCEKWLKDRRRRSLTEREVNHYQMMLVAVQRTMRLMAEIDEIIETNGGWPAVFALVPKSTTKKASS